MVRRESPKIAHITERMTALTGHADELVGSVKPLVANLDQAVTNVSTTVDAVREPLTSDLAELQRTLEDARALIDSVQRVVGDNEGDIHQTVQSLRTASDNVRLLSETLKERPWNLIRTTQPAGQEGPAMTNRRERALRAAFALVGALAISACGSARYPAHYTLHFEPSTQAPASRPQHRYCRDQGITLSRLSLRGPHRLSSDASRSRLLPISPLGQQPTGDDCAISRRTRSSAIALHQRVG